MVTLYVKTGCPFCALVLAKVDELGIEIDEKNIAEDTNLAELIEKGGKRQVPYLIDDECNVAIYESADIADYLGKKYGSGESAEAEGEKPLVCPS